MHELVLPLGNIFNPQPIVLSMFQRLLPLVVGLWLLAISNLSAQVGFTMPVINEAAPGGFAVLPVTVTNFDSIEAMQYVVQWDPQVLSYYSVTSLNLPGLILDDFATQDVQNGILRLTWVSPNAQTGTTVADNTAIFRIRFLLIGQENQGSLVALNGVPPTDFEVVKVGNPVGLTMEDCTLNNGYVAIGFTLSTDWLDGLNMLPVAITPNPFAFSTTATFELDKAADVYMVLTDASGHPVLDRKMSLPAGRHGMDIASDRCRESGIYYLILRTADRSCVRPLVKL